MRRLLLLCALLGAATVACTDASVKPGGAPPTVTTIAGAPGEGTPAERVDVTIDTAPVGLATIAGAVAVGTADGVLVGDLADATQLSPLPVAAEPGEPASTGEVALLARRQHGGVLVWAAAGLFHDKSGNLLPSPLSSALEGDTVKWLSAVGQDDAEELWIATDAGLLHVAGGSITTVAIEGAAAVDAAVAAGAGKAVIVGGGSAWLVDLGADLATPLAHDLGVLHGADRAEDGTVWLATDAGLLGYARDNRLAVYTLADSGSARVDSVAAAYGAVFATSGGRVLAIDASGAAAIGDAATTEAQGLAVDTNGDAWTTTTTGVAKLDTGAPVSFSKDVVPFLQKHCMGCHESGAASAPIRAFDDFAFVTSPVKEGQPTVWAEVVLQRLQADGVSPMPPASIERLTAADYAVVTRWFGGGMQP